MTPLEWLLFACLGTAGYVYVGYPLLLLVLGAVRRREVRKRDATPSMSLIIAAHNEQDGIAQKLENTLSLDYPRDRLETIVASDGSTDGTERIVRQYAARGVRLLSLPRGGKVAALNRAVAEAGGEIVAFTDANALLETRALRRLARNLSDPEVGGVCGNQRYRLEHSRDAAGEGENLYWTYDKWIKRLESRVGSSIAADGSIYAIRKRLFVPLEEAAQADDFAISVQVVAQGYRLVFEPDAISYEAPSASSEQEFLRRVRIANHNLRGLLYVKDVLNPCRYGLYAVEMLSHKVLRYAVPFLLPVAYAANAALARRSVPCRLLFLGQVLFSGCALAGYALRHSRWRRTKIFYAPYYFLLANAAALLGALSLLKGERITAWQPRREAARVAPDEREDLKV
jgi:cellulose synthase/poly-beta-1,6-N-acetylglucosamine synthase-like glycosyltransferase